MFATARAAAIGFSLVISSLAFGQTGPSDAQVIAAAPTAKINIGPRKLGGHVIATVVVGDDGRVREATITENTADPGFEPMIVKVLQSSRFRPAIDASNKAVESTVEIKVELRPSTGASPKPVAAKPDPQLTEKERARIRKMTCADFLWEWKFLEDAADDAAATEFLPRIAIAMYAAVRTEAGEYVDAKVWKASAKALTQTVDRCKGNPQALFWQDTFRPVMDEAVPK